MNTRNVLPISLIALSLTGCATMPDQQATTAEVRSVLLSQPVTVQPLEQPVALAERTKGRAVANTVIASMAATAAANVGGANTLQGMQANQTIASELGTQMARTLPEAELIKAGTGIDRALAHRLARYFEPDESSPTGDGIVIEVAAAKWELGYESFLTSSDYRLDYDIDVRVTKSATPDQPTRRLKTIDCSGTFDRKMPIDQWRADDYLEVDTAAHDIVDHCYELALAEMGMT
ncbi:hypothetical protein SR882_10930 [Guyparkeria halophila]|uniref:Lipoprotein n=1 Tax=Guyparkeria halophila TaxID=47960 RepID=A0ABZ0YVS0_9GAMM|nr:hypothetical protein [Guyparkeria halophila]WQH16259.1 hypothetical protein SR882_10930 [Guyparkeria halophila]